MLSNLLYFRAAIVPVFSFGENELFVQVSNPDGSNVRKLQNFLTKYLGFSPPLFHGRGIFQYNFGLIPYRKPITTIGKHYSLHCFYFAVNLPLFSCTVSYIYTTHAHLRKFLTETTRNPVGNKNSPHARKLNLNPCTEIINCTVQRALLQQ